MGFLLFCDNKGCGHDQEAVLDTKTNQVICLDCGKEIKNITSFTKTQLKAMGQIVRADTKQEAFAVVCSKCGKKGQPKIDAKDLIVCRFCSEELKEVPRPFQQVIRQHLRTVKNST